MILAVLNHSDFYVTAAAIIPTLFVAIAFSGASAVRDYRDKTRGIYPDLGTLLVTEVQKARVAASATRETTETAGQRHPGRAVAKAIGNLVPGWAKSLGGMLGTGVLRFVARTVIPLTWLGGAGELATVIPLFVSHDYVILRWIALASVTAMVVATLTTFLFAAVLSVAPSHQGQSAAPPTGPG